MPRKIKLCGKTRTIRQRNDGRWELRFTSNGKTVSVYDINQEKCIEKFKEVYKKKDKPQETKQKYILSAWLWDWLTTYKKPKLKPTSYAQLEICIRVHLLPNITDEPIDKLNAMEIQKGLNKITSSRMRKYSYNTICDALKTAYRIKLIKYNLADELQPVKHKRTIGQALNKEQQELFIKAIKGDTLELLFLFYLCTGTRKSEALAIEWKDIDEKNNLMRIPGTKTETSDRVIPLFDSVKEIIKKLPKKSPYLFATNEAVVSNHFKKIKAKLKSEGHNTAIFKIHNLRHTASTLWHERGIPSKVIQKWLGHSSVEITEQIYIHVLSDFEQKAVDKVNSDPIIDPILKE